MIMIILYTVLFIPLVAIVFLIFYRHFNSSLMDLNTMTTFRSLLFGVVNNKSSFLQNDDVTCFYHHESSSNTMDKQNTMNTNVHHHTTESVPKSSNVSKLKSVNIDYLPVNNFSFHPCELNAVPNVESKSLLVLFAWLFAKERHLDKYRKLYIEQGFDVLTIKVNVKDFIIPTVGSQVIASLVVRFLKERKDYYDSLVFHAFSVGAYQMGEVFVMLNQEHNKEVKKTARKLLKGIIYDSAADINEAPLGLSKATTTNRWLQWAICSLLNAHFRWCYHLATRHYIASSQVIHENEFRCPTLVFLSKDDEVVNYVDQFKTVDKWRQEGINVTVKCWEQSPHVSHFFKHPDEYRSLVVQFLGNIIIVDNNRKNRQ